MKSQLVPKLNSNDDVVEIVDWKKGLGQKIEKGDELAELATTKATIVIESEFSGYLMPGAQKGDRLRISDPLAFFFDSFLDLKVFEKSRPSKVASAEVLTASARFSKPALRELSTQGLPVDEIGHQGLVTKRQLVENLVFKKNYKAEQTSLAKRAEISNLKLGQSGMIPNTLMVQLNARKIFENPKLQHIVGKSLLPIVLYEFSRVLIDFPNLNSFYHEGQIFKYNDIHVGLAIDLGQGLLVAKIAKTNRLTIDEIQIALAENLLKYARHELRPEDLSGTTVTVSDLSADGVLFFTPLLSPGQSCILGIGGDSSNPERPISLCLTFDHQTSTGREVSQLLAQLKKNIAKWSDI